MSVRDYMTLWSGARTDGGSGGAALGGNVLLRTPQHKLDGPEHLSADDTNRLDATVDHHGLLPKLSGVADDALRGDGTWGAVTATGSWVPTYVGPGDTFTIPDNSQALFAVPIELDVGAGIVVGTNSALVEVH